MGAFRFFGIPEAVAREVRESLRAPGYGHPAHREQAHGYGPCRLCLRTFRVGADERILFTYNPFLDAGSLPAPGPVFIHGEPCARYDALELPPDFRALPIVVEGYRRGGRLVVQERVAGRSPQEMLARIFAAGGADYAHLRNAEAGCFMARVEALSS